MAFLLEIRCIYDQSMCVCSSFDWCLELKLKRESVWKFFGIYVIEHDLFTCIIVCVVKIYLSMLVRQIYKQKVLFISDFLYSLKWLRIRKFCMVIHGWKGKGTNGKISRESPMCLLCENSINLPGEIIKIFLTYLKYLSRKVKKHATFWLQLLFFV